MSARVVNMTASAKYKPLCLLEVALNENACITKKRRRKRKRIEPESGGWFLSVTYKIRPTSVTALVYESGSVVFIGAKSNQELYEAIRVLSEEISRPLPTSVRISNYVATLKTAEISLVKLHSNLNMALFEPEIFPSLIAPYKGIKVIFFRSGVIIITGCKSLEEVNDAEVFALSAIKRSCLDVTA